MMSDKNRKLTRISLPGLDHPGLADWGECSIEDMTDYYRKWAMQTKLQVEEILSAADADFRIETYRGPWVQKDRKIIQEGKPHD